MFLISIIAPCFNESKCILPFYYAIKDLFYNLDDYEYEIIFINDGSSDDTLSKMIICQSKDTRVTIIDFSRNFGKEAALTAGINHATGDAVIPMDIDLQHPPSLIPEMLHKWKDGYEVVLAKRKNRSDEKFIKRCCSHFFYHIHNIFSKPKLPIDVGDFRLMDKNVVNSFKALPENCRFLKGIFAWLGYKATTIEFDVMPRYAGKSKFNLLKLWNFALDGITGFSTIPLKIWSYIGAIFAIMSFIYGTIILMRTLIFGVDLPGYASLLVAITFLGGLQLIGIGVLGEYIGRTYIESKHRPIYLIRKIYKTKTE